jgi:molecular chaperone GrpE
MSVSDKIAANEQKVDSGDEQAAENEEVTEKVETAVAEAEVSDQVEVSDESEVAEEALSLEEQLALAQEEAARNLDGWLRAKAEFANARKRMEKQRAETYVNATANAVAGLLPVMDDFERALASAPGGIAESDWYEGVKLVYRKLETTLEGFNVEPIPAVGEPFDPNFHEALSQEPSQEYESGVVTQELQKGYKLGDRVIRPSLVYVAE